MAHSCSEKTPSPFSFHAKSMASQSPFARQLPPLTCFLITSKCCSRITPRFLKSESLPSSLNVSRGNDVPFRENAACASSVQCTYVCNVVYCCTVCCTSTAVLLYGAPPPPQCSYCSRHRLSGRRSYLHPQFIAQLVGACSYWHLGTEHVFLWPCAYYYYFLRLKFLTTKFLTGDAVCTSQQTVSADGLQDNSQHRKMRGIETAICAPSIRPDLCISSRGFSGTCRRASLTSFRGCDPDVANSGGTMVCRPDTHSRCGRG